MRKLIAVVATLVIVGGVFVVRGAVGQPDKPMPTTIALEKLEANGIYLTLPAQAENPISRGRAEQVARENAMGGKVTNSFMAQMREQAGPPGTPATFTGPVWVVEFEPSSSGWGVPLAGPRHVPPDAKSVNDSVLVFVDAETGAFIEGVAYSHAE